MIKIINIKSEFFILVIFAFILVVSALATTYSVHLSRQYVGELSELRREQDALQVEWEKLLVEINMLTAYSRVEKTAINSLGMHEPNEDDVRIIDLRSAL